MDIAGGSLKTKSRLQLPPPHTYLYIGTHTHIHACSCVHACTPHPHILTHACTYLLPMDSHSCARPWASLSWYKGLEQGGSQPGRASTHGEHRSYSPGLPTRARHLPSPVIWWMCLEMNNLVGDRLQTRPPTCPCWCFSRPEPPRTLLPTCACQPAGILSGRSKVTSWDTVGIC